MPTIDCDAHVVESVQTWEFMEPGDRKYRPKLVAPDGDDGTQYWVVDDKIRGLARQVMTSETPIELSPQSSYIRRLQHQLAQRYNLSSRSIGQEPYRRVTILPGWQP